MAGTERLSSILIGGLAAFALLPAVAIGGVHPELQVSVLALATVLMGVFFWYRSTRGKISAGASENVVPLPVLFLFLLPCLLDLFQLVPLPRWLLSVLSPQAAVIRGLVDESRNTFWPISLSPSATRIELVKHLTLAFVFWMAAHHLYRGERALLVARVFIYGAVALAALGLIQRMVGAQRIAWVYAPDWWDGFMATFVNGNHAAGFFLLAEGVCVGYALSERGPARYRRLVFALLIIAAIVATGSRAGLGGLAVLAVSLIVFSGTSTKESFGIGVLIVFAGLLALAVAGPDSFTRFQRLAAGPLTADQKLRAWMEVLPMSWSFWRTGVGRGAFAEAFPHFQRSSFTVTITHPENILFQTASEWGWLATIVLLLLVAWTLRYLLIGRRLEALERGVLCGMFALFAQNCFDFNLEFLGTAVPAAIFCGLLVGRKHRLLTRGPGTPTPARLGWPVDVLPLSRGAIVAGVIGLVLGVPALRHTLRVDEAALRGMLKPDATVDPVRAEAAAKHHPMDYMVHLLVGSALARAGNEHGLSHLNRSMELNPRDGKAHLETARILASNGHARQAAIEYREAITLGIPLSETLIDEIMQVAGSAEIALRAIPDDVETRLTFARRLESQKIAPDVALVTYEEVLRASKPPAIVNLQALRGVVRLAAQPRSAELALRLAEISPVPGDLFLAANVLAKAGETEKADQIFVDAAPRFPGQWPVVGRAADILIRRKNLPLALRWLNDVVDSNSSRAVRASALEKLASAYELLGQSERAETSRLHASRLRD